MQNLFFKSKYEIQYITSRYDYSTDYVYFLDTKVKFKEYSLITEIYSKPTASFQYLQRTSYDPTYMFRSILKSQFIRIRRICSDIKDYWSDYKRFANFFISKFSPRDLFKNNHNTLINQVLESEKTSRIPFVTTWHQKLACFQSTLLYRYQEMINDYPELKCIFPTPPTLAYRRNRNLSNLLVHSSLTKPTPKTSKL